MKRARATLSPEVQAAVDDILNGTSINSESEWLQREYARLMRREARMRQECESKLSAMHKRVTSNGGSSRENRSIEQHSAAVDAIGADQDTDNMH